MRTSLAGLVFAGLSISLASVASAQTTWTWNGGDGEYTSGSNWTPGSRPDLTGTNNTAVISAGAVTYTPGGDLTISNGSTLRISGGSWTQAGGIAYIQMAGGNLLIDGGSFNQGESGAIVRNSNSTITVSSGSATFNGAFANNGTMTISGGTTSFGGEFSSETTGTLNVLAGVVNVTGNLAVNTGTLDIAGGTINISNELKALGAGFSVSGGTINASIISFDDLATSFDFSGGTINLSTGGFEGIYGPNGYINFTTGSDGELHLGSISTTAAQSLLTSRVRLNDAIDAEAFEILSDGASGSIVRLIPSAIPEPSAFAMLAGLASFGFVASRRRRG